MYIPTEDTRAEDIWSFADALAQEQSAVVDYDRQRWLYVPCVFAPYRYILGTRGQRPLICIGINPSTATPHKLDNTLKSVARVAMHKGFDSFIMFNVYAQRATNPDHMDAACNARLHAENMAAFRYVLANCVEKGMTPAVWAAWGTIIEKRPYLWNCLRDMIAIGKEYGARWICVGERSKKGHPHHPLYLRSDSPIELFDVDAYCAGAEVTV